MGSLQPLVPVVPVALCPWGPPTFHPRSPSSICSPVGVGSGYGVAFSKLGHALNSSLLPIPPPLQRPLHPPTRSPSAPPGRPSPSPPSSWSSAATTQNGAVRGENAVPKKKPGAELGPDVGRGVLPGGSTPPPLPPRPPQHSALLLFLAAPDSPPEEALPTGPHTMCLDARGAAPAWLHATKPPGSTFPSTGDPPPPPRHTPRPPGGCPGPTCRRSAAHRFRHRLSWPRSRGVPHM